MANESSTTLQRSLAIQARVIYALVMREIITRYGRHNIGFAWLFVEPMLFTIGVMALWSTLHDISSSHHLSIMAFAITSYSTVLVWRNTIGRCSHAVEPNAALLFHRNVRIIDLFLARIVLEIAGITLSMVVLLTLCVIAGLIPAPQDMLTMAAGWALLAWYSCAMALLIGGLSEYSEMVERLWHPISYFQLPISGAFVMASWLPPKLRDIVMIFPVPHCVEMFRYGYFGNSITPYYNVPYVSVICLVLTWLGLAVVRNASKHVESQ
ncbi:ABC transporter permease [Paraburkholderia sp. D1E]|uniref:ABC transporter permease n=1 Tax=Paraburkholderia sp. D1E TaxID=3461398 RepID=UPI0040467C39